VCARARADYTQRAIEEHQRLLYVAMTRARDRLILCGYANQKSSEAAAGSWHEQTGRAMARIGEAFDAPFGQGFRLGARLPATQAAPPMATAAAPALPKWMLEPAPAEAGPIEARPSGAIQPSAWKAPTAARLARGQLLHGLLQRLASHPPPERIAAGLAWLRGQGVTVQGDGDPLLREALTVLDAPDFAAVFGPGSRAEVGVCAHLPGGRRIDGVVDRLVVRGREVLLVDFKTDQSPPATIARTPHRILLQMALYRFALSAIFPNHAVRSALIWTAVPRLDPLPDAMLDAIDLTAETG
jgi:ATP-dependent helicase/nuclease subunit A